MLQSNRLSRLVAICGLLFLTVLMCAPSATEAQESEIIRERFANANEAYRNKDYSRAYYWWNILAEAGHAKAQSNLALLFLRGHGGRQERGPGPAVAGQGSVSGGVHGTVQPRLFVLDTQRRSQRREQSKLLVSESCAIGTRDGTFSPCPTVRTRSWRQAQLCGGPALDHPCRRSDQAGKVQKSHNRIQERVA